MQRLRVHFYRLRNALCRLRHGLPLHGESVWPGAPTDLFQAHLSIYEFWAEDVKSLRVLDAGCGTGYGSALLRERGAARVLGIDRHSPSIHYAVRTYRRVGLEFRVEDLQDLRHYPEGSFDRIVASNVLEHLRDPSDFLVAAHRLLAPSGALWVAVPPIVDESSLAANRANPYHISNLFVADWLRLFSSLGFEARLHRHLYLGQTPDFSSPLPSVRTAGSFTVAPASLDDFYREPCLGAVFALETGTASGVTAVPGEDRSKPQLC